MLNRGGEMKKAKFHYEAAAMAGCEVSRYKLGLIEVKVGNMERAIKHWTIAASAGNCMSMYNLLVALEKGYVSRESIDSTLTAYNNSCAEMRSKARDAAIQFEIDNPDYE
jgi:TPR repeat protein